MKRILLVIGIFALIAGGSVYFFRIETRNLEANLTATGPENGQVTATTTEVVEATSTATSTPEPVSAPDFEVLNTSIAQGDSLLISFQNGRATSLAGQAATFNGKPMHIFDFGGKKLAIYPISATQAPGNYLVKAIFENGQTAEKTLAVKKSDFPVFQMPQPGGPPSPEVEAQLEAEALDFKAVFARPDESALFGMQFVSPLHIPLKIVSPFGELRQYPDGTGTRHLGVDLGALTGTRVYAINDGTVIKIKNYLSYGNTIVIDHGAGIYSIYLHLSRVDVKVGEKVSRNGAIGLVGDTGYVTGPHLHLSLKIGEVSVDPLKFIDILK